MSNEIKTPRTDCSLSWVDATCQTQIHAGMFPVVRASTARTLERETVELRERYDRLKTDFKNLHATFIDRETQLKTAVSLLGEMVVVSELNGHSINCLCKLCKTRNKSESFLESNKTK